MNGENSFTGGKDHNLSQGQLKFIHIKRLYPDFVTKYNICVLSRAGQLIAFVSLIYKSMSLNLISIIPIVASFERLIQEKISHSLNRSPIAQ
jgi:hypothetical protein